jgi:hypothetical protein
MRSSGTVSDEHVPLERKWYRLFVSTKMPFRWNGYGVGVSFLQRLRSAGTLRDSDFVIKQDAYLAQCNNERKRPRGTISL